MRTRFAPSPTGPLHLGHAYSALLAFEMAREQDGEFLLRIEDIDHSRARPEWEAQIYDDLQWLGLSWPTPVRHQSDQLSEYAVALRQLDHLEVIYPCKCNRRDIEAAASAPQEGVPEFGPDGRIYPGTCRNRKMSERQPADAIRLNTSKAMSLLDTIEFQETGPIHTGKHSPVDPVNQIGDIVLSRRDMGTSYHLAVVIDDAAQQITHVIRGEDLFEATHIHVILQALLGLPTPIYHHHKLIRDDAGKRLAKRDDARAIAKFRSDGATPNDIRELVGLK